MEKETLIKTFPGHWLDLRLLFTGAATCYNGHSYGPAVRPYYLIHFIRSGKGILKIADHTFHLHAHQAFVIKPNELTYYQADFDAPWQYTWIAFDGRMAATLMTQLGFEFPFVFASLSAEEFHAIDQQLGRLKQQNNNLVVDQLLDQSCLLNILLTLAEISRIPGTHKRSNVEPAAKKYVDQAIALIQQNYKRPLTTKKLAAKINIDRSYLSTIFRRQTGMTLKDYLTLFRISRSKEILFTTDWPITEVARISGYNSVSYFSKAFKHHLGMSPRSYRQWRRTRLEGKK
ncbi:AraC family transcriptional regulator [Sporolactobacillus sp. Y61]|uniref:AraC family transcriptional regulator n=1 Tax=Sporolactobacillus sp. Y61 TaxID=3160863 RepID=A0AAU8IHX6_9BACL